MEWFASWNEDHEEQLSLPLTKLSDLSLDFARGFSLVFPIVRLGVCPTENFGPNQLWSDLITDTRY